MLTDEISGRSSSLYERFFFNLDWSPAQFQELPHEAETLIDAGELELF
jgi:hypothetical protein